MKTGLKQKIILSFLAMTILDLLLGVIIYSSMRHVAGVVKEITEIGRKINVISELANGALEESLLLLMTAGRDDTEDKSGELLGKIHLQILSNIDLYMDKSPADLALKSKYTEYWENIQEALKRSGSDVNSIRDLEMFHKNTITPAAEDIEKNVYQLTERYFMRLVDLQIHMESHNTFHRLMRLPDSYNTAVESFSSGFEQIYVYYEVWAEVLKLQIDEVGTGNRQGQDHLDRVRDRLQNLNIWLDSELEDRAALDNFQMFKEEERKLLLKMKKWVNGYLPYLDKCLARGSEGSYSCYLSRFEMGKDLQRRILQYASMEINRVADNMALVRKSVISLTRIYTTVFAFFAIMAWVLALYIGKTILNPIKLLRKGFAKVSVGELQFRLPVGLITDEFGKLQEGFNRMAVAIESRDKELMEARVDLENLAFKIQHYNEDLEREVKERTRELHKAYEDMKENDQMKAEFIANMSHELRTPLNSIIGFSKVILKGIDGPINERQKQDLTLIHKSGQHLLNLIAHILDFSKLEADSLELQKSPIDLGDVAEEAVMSVHSLVKDKPVHIHMEVAPLLPRIEADRMRILQVMINLLGNAAKFTERGSIRLDIVSWTPSHPVVPEEELVAFDNGVLITVSDTGIGIPEDSRDLVFEKFQQVDGSSTRAYGGTGLGLAIARELVILHGGHIWFESTPGKGSKFYVLLPVN